jgi:hypothetical protein
VREVVLVKRLISLHTASKIILALGFLIALERPVFARSTQLSAVSTVREAAAPQAASGGIVPADSALHAVRIIEMCRISHHRVAGVRPPEKACPLLFADSQVRLPDAASLSAAAIAKPTESKDAS